MTMTIGEARQRIRNLETEIRAAITGFEETTGLLVEQVCVDRLDITRIGSLDESLTRVSVDVRMPRAA